MTTLQSPGVNVSVVNESFYTPAAPGTVPMIFVATAQDKQNASGTGIAQGTTLANAGKVWVITSQRDLTDTFGTPYFETDAEGNPIHGGERNEYGLQAAYSLLGVSSKAYIIRGDADLGSLAPYATPPAGAANNNQYWIDTSDSIFGINEWDATANNNRGGFTAKTPLIIDDSNSAVALSGGVPVNTFGTAGDYAMVIIKSATPALFYRSSSIGWTAVADGFDGGKKLVISAHYDYPNFTNATATGSVWVKTTTPGLGANWDIKHYSSTKMAWVSDKTVGIYSGTNLAIAGLDPVGGGVNIPVGTVIIDSDSDNNNTGNFKPHIRFTSGPTIISATSSTVYGNGSSGQVTIKETKKDGTWNTPVAIAVVGNNSNPKLGALIAAVINSSTSLVNVVATWDSVTNTLSLKHQLGGNFELQASGDSDNLMSKMGFVAGTSSNLYTAPSGDGYTYIASNWRPLAYKAQATQPVTTPEDGTLWYDNGLDVDILYNDGSAWKGYRNVTALQNTDPAGPIVSASEPTVQSNGNALVTGDIWVDTSNPDMYGQNIYIYDAGLARPAWVHQDVTDHTTPNGWVFADARWSTTGLTDSSVVTPVASLLVSDYVDPDCPDPRLYPRGTRLFNTRRSGNNVKKLHAGYINTTANGGINIRTGQSLSGDVGDRWVTASPNNEHGVGTFGRLAQRGVVVKALNAVITANQSIRDTDTLTFNLIATPGYPETIQDMVAFNTDIGGTAFVVGDTPFRLEPTGTALTSYGLNTPKAANNDDTAAVTYDTSLGMFYPSGYTNDNTGGNIVVPPSHMMLRTIMNSDAKSYVWFAPAGTRRGTIDNASSVGYVAEDGTFRTASLHQGLRDVLAGVKINPIATLPGVGLVNMGQYTRANSASALDRINVSRLVSYLRRQLNILAKPFLFEPNDAQTRNEIKAAAESLLLELVGQRALYDYVVVCDSTNNTPARIDRNELYLDIAIEPVKSVEFIYIPLRLLNTGAIASGNTGAQFGGSGA